MAQTNPLDSPMMQQYLAFKEQCEDAILFFRMGDFYEMFFEDAVKASEILGITLTSRHKDAEIPMAGVPHHSADKYIKTLLDEGIKVAIAEQIEKPDKTKKAVARKVIRILTPGTVIEESSLEEAKSNYFLTVASTDKECAVSWCDVSCGELLYATVEKAKINEFIQRISPREIVELGEPHSEERYFVSEEDYDIWIPSSSSAKFMETWDEKLISKLETKALYLILFYLDKLYFGDFPPLKLPKLYRNKEFASFDSTTASNLEIEETLIGGKRKGSLIWAIDRTVTSMGRRLLRNSLKNPYSNENIIKSRIAVTSFFYENESLRKNVISEMKKVKDIERLLARISVKRGGPTEIITLASSLKTLYTIYKKVLEEPEIPLLLSDFPVYEERILSITEEWLNKFVEEPPINYKEGGFINREKYKEIEELRYILDHSRDLILKLEEEEKEKTGIPKLKVGYTRVFGYYIEISKRFSDKVPEEYIRKQTTVNAERYFTAKLKELEEKILNAKELIIEKEMNILEECVKEIENMKETIQKLSEWAAFVDMFSSFADLAAEENFVMPTIKTEEGIKIINGRHPVIEKVITRSRYVPASISVGFENSKLSIITGPNMGGKSTIMRMTAIIVLLAQIGSFVPADEAEIGVVDGIFTRVGASDNLSKGESTFLVEMKESAFILNNATEKSLIVLDEIGRGTGTYDGISIARGMAEYLIEKVKAITLFATHYHILTELAADYDSVKNFHMRVRETGGDLHFLYQISEGGSSRSFGVEVAKLAGVPKEIIRKAEKYLKSMERVDRKLRFEEGHSMQLDIFSMQMAEEERNKKENDQRICKLNDILKQNSPDDITPRQAFELYCKISDIMKEEKS